MNNSDLISAIAKVTGETKVSVEAVIKTLPVAMSTALQNGEDVNLTGIGKFKATERAARNGHNPKTGEAMKIPAKTVVKFKVAKSLADSVA